MIHSNSEGFQWFESLDEAKADGWFPIKVTSLLCMFRLKGRTSVISTENLEIIPDLRYAYRGQADKDSPLVYYVKEYRGWDLNLLWFYKATLGLEEDDLAVRTFRYRCKAGDVWLLMNKEQVEDISAMLKRVYKAQTKLEGKLPFRQWLELAEYEIKYSDYQANCKNLTGYKTACRIFMGEIEAIWKRARESQK